MSSPSVSVLVTVYNRAEYLAECLRSILSSTWQDFEVVVVDDASTDQSLEIARTIAREDNRVHVMVNEVNLGDYANRRRAAELAEAPIIKYVDSDDIIYPHALAVMMNALSADPSAGFAISHSLAEDEQPYPWRLTPAEAWRKEFLGNGCMGAGPSGAIIRKAALEEAGGFREWGVLSDTHLWYRMSAQSPVVLLPPALVWWRKHDEQQFRTNGAELVYLERGFDLTMRALAWKECPLSEDERARAIGRARHRHSRRLLSLGLKQGKYRDAFRLIGESGLSASELFGGLAPYA